MTQHVVVLLIIDMESPKSEVNGPKKKVSFWRILTKKWQKNQTKTLKKHIYPNCIELNLSFKKIEYDFRHIKSHSNLKSSWLALDFSVRLSVQYTRNTLYLAQKHKNMLQKRTNPNCIIINASFHNFKIGGCQNKSDLNLKSSFLTLDFGHKGQSGVLAQTCSVWTLYQLKLLKNMFWWRKSNLFGPT